jgi:hypothetical protein
MPAPSRVVSRLLVIMVLLTFSQGRAQVSLTSDGAAAAVILTRPNPPGYIQLAAQELRDHVEAMSGAVLPVDVVGTEANYPEKSFVYVGTSAATIAAGISTTGLDLEHYVIRTINNNLHLVGRDGGGRSMVRSRRLSAWHALRCLSSAGGGVGRSLDLAG